MKNNFFAALFVLLTLLACDKDESSSSKGDLYVKVFMNNGFSKFPAKGVSVFTVPPTKQVTTDEFGGAILKDIDVASYEVYANLDGYGSGKTAVRVSANSLEEAEILIEQGVKTGFTPEITQILPSLPASFSLNEKIVFSFDVRDSDSKASDITVVISSNLDGKLLETRPDASNNVKFETTKLTRGKHIVTVTATDKDKYFTTKTIEVATIAPSSITLESAIPNSGNVELKWQKYTSTDFKKYEVLRSLNKDSEGEVIETFSSADITTFLDKLPPFANEVFYYVRVSNNENYSRNSNKLNVLEPAGKIYNYSITDAVHHPSEPIVYIVDNAAHKLRAINYKTNQEIDNVSIDATVGKIDIGNNGFGLEIYVPNENGFIKVYNANTLNLVTSINTGLATRCVVTNGHGYLVASVKPSPWWEQPIRTYSRSTGINISGNGDFDGDYIRFIPNSDKIITITTSISPVDMEYLELDSNGKILSHVDDKYHGDHPLDANIFRISSNGEFVITGSVGAVYSASSSMIYKGMVDRGALFFSDFAFGNNGNTIYAGTSNRPSLQIIKYPSLTRDNEILLKGYPKFLFNFKGDIISLSRTSQNGSEGYAFEIVNIN
ncbi:hypothetical protein SAMN05444143_103219 [Flavobacterium succinicans]|uniref:Uncharacterized protein n=1 Tax=Flavobacterium succinicans TaxID=29536 RepID=A0A1I4ULQ5_9FLAO|nr:hypothetical protein [Flavobacterium succinicans]SFM89633.1 hypothetical protein SAMN05444143_103219 [Flavobacterium succinicans]